MKIIKWLDQPEEQDYPAAESYLTLLGQREVVRGMITRLRMAPIVEFKAGDIFRASGLPLLSVDNFHVESNISKIAQGMKLSPLLLIRDSSQGKVVIADGYHRLCAVYNHSEDAMIPCKIV